MRIAVLAVLTASLLGCSPQTGRRSRGGDASDLDAYCEVTATPGLVRFDGEVATICEGGGCMLARVQGGALAPLAVSDARMGYAASRGRTLVLHDDGRLTILEGGEEVELAAWAADVFVEEDGEHALFVGLREADTGFGEDVEDPETGELTAVAGVTLVSSPELGTRIVRMDLDTAEVQEIVDDPMAGTPIDLPGTDDILYVGAPDGVAALLRVTPGGAPRQLTNAGVTEIGQEFVPVPLHEVVVDGARVFYSVAEAALDAEEAGPASAALWAVDVETGAAELLGEGRFPTAGDDGVIAVVDDTPAGGCAATYIGAEGA